MSTVSPLPSPRPYTSRTFTPTEAGGQTTFSRTLESGAQVTGGATLTQTDTGVRIEVSRTGPGGRTVTAERDVSAEQVAAYKESLGDIAQRLRERLAGGEAPAG
jgi:hypothetical protein